MESEIQWYGGVTAAATERTGRRKPETETNVCGLKPGAQGTEGYRRKKVITVRERKRLAQEAMEENQLSERQTCRFLGISRTVFRYQSKKTNDEEIVRLLMQIAERKPRWGFKKKYVFLKNQGYQWNHKKVRRIYREIGLNLRIKPKKTTSKPRSSTTCHAGLG